MAKNQNHAAPAAADPAVSEAPEVVVVEPPVEPEAAEPAGEVKARILRDCVYGMCDEVVTLDASLIESLSGVVDADPAAVAYAESLAK